MYAKIQKGTIAWLQYVREKVNHALTLDMMEVEKFEERKKDYEEDKAEARRLSY